MRSTYRATKFILNDYESSYKTRLKQLHLLPLMYVFEFNDLMFLVKSLKEPIQLISTFISMYIFPKALQGQHLPLN